MKKILLITILLFGYANADIATLEGAKKACDNGDSKECFKLGEIYTYSDKGVKQDYKKAAKFYKKACDGEYAEGCFELGFLYLKGRGVKESNSKAKELFGKACDHQSDKGCKNYAILNKK